MIQFIKSKTAVDGQRALTACLKEALAAHQRVLWLVPGGSNISITVAVMKQISVTDSTRLAIMLTDERYGQPGHKDSNWQQLEDAGLKLKKATTIPLLRDGLSLQDTTNLYAQVIARALNAAEVIIGQFGIGADGHIAGILPGSPAVRAKELVAAYETPDDFTRITLTFPALRRLDEAFVCAYGANKQAALTTLRDKTLPLAKQPAQILKRIPGVCVYNDQIGG